MSDMTEKGIRSLMLLTLKITFIYGHHIQQLAPVEYSTINMIELKQKIIYTTLNLSKINFFSSGMLWGVQRRSNSDTEI